MSNVRKQTFFSKVIENSRKIQVNSTSNTAFQGIQVTDFIGDRR